MTRLLLSTLLSRQRQQQLLQHQQQQRFQKSLWTVQRQSNATRSLGKLYFSTSTTPTSTTAVGAWQAFESSHGSKIRALPEVQAVDRFLSFLKTTAPASSNVQKERALKHVMSKEQHLQALDAAMATFSLHVHARIASMVGHGFYTIGPCGEELLAAAAMAMKPEDSTALHYRHTAMSVARQLNEGTSSLEDVLLARARGYTVSRNDPITGGVHCSIGGGANEFVVTSTLSSQCPSAVGRALGYSLLPESVRQQRHFEPQTKPVSFVTIGDGSLHNHHFLSSYTLARHAKHLKIKCPVVFGISNNGISISYKTQNYVDSVFATNTNKDGGDPLIPVFNANGQDMLSVYDQTKQAMEYSRQYSSPCVLLYSNLVRRFGHAATDRQAAYLTNTDIQAMEETCVLELAAKQAVEELQYITYAELYDRFQDIHTRAEQAFAQAMQEPKVSLEDMIARVSPPLASLPSSQTKSEITTVDNEKPQVMRKHMTRIYDEFLANDPSVVYLGEDVRHGGYYLVTEGLAAKYPKQVMDFPPDETTLLGAGLGFAQLGLTPIVEIPYAKYIDCGVDMFTEIAIQHWLTSAPNRNEQKPTNGMIIRLQGFDRGVFGGNFHTHNMLSHMPPGVDVVCFSNGWDYVQGMRHALLQAKAGRIVMVVDCTNLLNLRHVHDRDRLWEYPFSTDPSEMLSFDMVRVYSAASSNGDSSNNMAKATTAIVSYGNGVVTSLQARKDMVDSGSLESEEEVDIIDCPYLSGIPKELEEKLKQYDTVLFADICKEGPGSNVFSSMIMSLKEHGTLPPRWSFVGAPRTYNPLGSTVTFLNRETIQEAMAKLMKDP